MGTAAADARVNALGGNTPYRNPKTLAAIWRTAFLVVPVISTTFASVGRMLRDVPVETFAWAIVDEAGQAAPQASVGLLRRSAARADRRRSKPNSSRRAAGRTLRARITSSVRRSRRLGRQRRRRRFAPNARGSRLTPWSDSREHGRETVDRHTVVRSSTARRRALRTLRSRPADGSM